MTAEARAILAADIANAKVELAAVDARLGRISDASDNAASDDSELLRALYEWGKAKGYQPVIRGAHVIMARK
jgi:hypothetical protein